MEIRRIAVSAINPAPYNPRKDLGPSDPEYRKLKQSIEEFGFVEPLVWNRRTGNLVGGHQRFKILTGRGDTDVECSVVDLAPSREKALNVALNRIAGDWDRGKLAAVLAELDADGEVDLALTGFDQDEVDELMQSLRDPDSDDVADDDFDADAAVRAITAPVTQLGDVWLLGGHRLMCGDATSLGDVQCLMDGRQANMAFTDPPYNVDYTGKTKDALKIQNDDMGKAAFSGFLVDSFRNMFSTVTPGGPIYVCHADSGGLLFRQAFIEAGWLLKQCLIWVKNSFVMGRQDYHWQHEPILYGWKPGAGHHWYGDRDKSTVIDDDVDIPKLTRPELVALVKALRNTLNTTAIREDRPHVNDIHPTMKPVSLVAKLLRNSSSWQDVVQDLFGGGGSTLMAAEQTDRRCCMMELDPRYCDVIIQRWQAFTGQQAVRAGDGVPFGRDVA